MVRINNKAQINLAIQALKCDHKLSIRRATKIYAIDFSSLVYRKRGRILQYNYIFKLRKLTDLEEKTIVYKIFKLNF